MKACTDDYVLRKLRHEDYDDIVEMCRNIWDGSDYLPEVFHQWVDAEGVFMGAIDPETKAVIGCAKYTILEDGKGWMEGLRVKAEYRGQKIATLLTDTLLDLALTDYRAGVTPAVGYSTHITSGASLKMMSERNFKKVSECMLIIKPYETWDGLSEGQKNLKVEPWEPTYEEFCDLPYIQRRQGDFNFAFVYQRPTRALHQSLLKKGALLKVNGFRGLYQCKGEPNFLALDETFEAIDAFANYALSVNLNLGKPEPLSYLLGDDEGLNEQLKAAGYITLCDWQKDYFYFLYSSSDGDFKDNLEAVL